MRFDTNNPRYQRAVQVLGRYSPRQKAIFSTALADEQFAASEMGKKMQLMAMGIDKKYAEGRLDIRRERQKMFKKGFRRDKKMNTIAEMLGTGNVLASGYLGHQNLENKFKLAQLLGKAG